MDHVAIMRKSWGLTEKILSGVKRIESRWYMSRCAPWDSISAGDAIYFKNSGEPVKIRANVARILRFANLTPTKVLEILDRYGKADGIEKSDVSKFYKLFRSEKYCILVFLKDVKKVKPFEIDKSGFGAMSAWISIGDINWIKKRQTKR
jgi:hypothetical protein